MYTVQRRFIFITLWKFMILSSEVKRFIKNTCILSIFFALVLHLSWGYIVWIFDQKSQAGANDLTFQKANVTYLGGIATAMSLSLWQKESFVPIVRWDTIIENTPIADIFSRPTIWQQKIISNNMMAISSYAWVLSTDIITLLDKAPNRQAALNDHIALLKNYGIRTKDRIQIIETQIADLNGVVASTSEKTNQAKSIMQWSFVNYEYSHVDTAISNYIEAKNRENRAKIYLVYLDNFKKSYQALQTRNYKLLDALVNNRQALIDRSTVVIPNSGSEIVKQLKLIQTEAQYKKSTK